TLKSCMVM
ncbi:transglycosylase SLT domain protein, partial [Vibrio harveyi]